MLTALDNNGQMSHWCGACGGRLDAHISHEDVQFHLVEGAALNTRTVGLPACNCGAKTFLKVDFTSQELSASNMIDAQGNPTESYAVAQRHMQLARQMEVAGKLLATTTSG